MIQGKCQAMQGISCERGSALIDTVKPAEDGNGVILRLYESAGKTTAEQKLILPKLASVYASSMDEEQTGPLLAHGNEVPLCLKPFEIVTLRVVFD